MKTTGLTLMQAVNRSCVFDMPGARYEELPVRTIDFTSNLITVSAARIIPVARFIHENIGSAHDKVWSSI